MGGEGAWPGQGRTLGVGSTGMVMSGLCRGMFGTWMSMFGGMNDSLGCRGFGGSGGEGRAVGEKLGAGVWGRDVREELHVGLGQAAQFCSHHKHHTHSYKQVLAFKHCLEMPHPGSTR